MIGRASNALWREEEWMQSFGGKAKKKETARNTKV
jgi:hypothetical protein